MTPCISPHAVMTGTVIESSETAVRRWNVIRSSYEFHGSQEFAAVSNANAKISKTSHFYFHWNQSGMWPQKNGAASGRHSIFLTERVQIYVKLK